MVYVIRQYQGHREFQRIQILNLVLGDYCASRYHAIRSTQKQTIQVIAPKVTRVKVTSCSTPEMEPCDSTESSNSLLYRNRNAG